MFKIRQAFASFNLPFLSLPVSTPKETALDVFIKMNTSATPLSTYDIVVAQVEAAMGKSLHDLVALVREACPTIAEYYTPDRKGPPSGGRNSLERAGEIRGQEFLDATDRVIGEARQDTGQIGVGIDAVELGEFDQAVHGRGPFPGSIVRVRRQSSTNLRT